VVKPFLVLFLAVIFLGGCDRPQPNKAMPTPAATPRATVSPKPMPTAAATPFAS